MFNSEERIMPVVLISGSSEIEVRLTSEGFKLKSKNMKKWEYVRKEHVLRLCSILNATFGYNNQPGRIKLSLPIEEREGITLTKQRNIIRNTALVVKILYPELVKIDKGFIISLGKIPTDEYTQRLSDAFSESRSMKLESGVEAGIDKWF